MKKQINSFEAIQQLIKSISGFITVTTLTISSSFNVDRGNSMDVTVFYNFNENEFTNFTKRFYEDSYSLSFESVRTYVRAEAKSIFLKKIDADLTALEIF
jgi:hypothetical protein